MNADFSKIMMNKPTANKEWCQNLDIVIAKFLFALCIALSTAPVANSAFVVQEDIDEEKTEQLSVPTSDEETKELQLKTS